MFPIRLLLLLILLLEGPQLSNAICEKKRSTGRISFKNDGKSKCSFREKLAFGGGYVVVDVQEVELVASNHVEIFGNAINTSGARCLLFTLPTSSCAVEQTDKRGECTAFEAKKGSFEINLASDHAEEYLVITLTNKQCQEKMGGKTSKASKDSKTTTDAHSTMVGSTGYMGTTVSRTSRNASRKIPKGRNLPDSKQEPTDAQNSASPVKIETNGYMGTTVSLTSRNAPGEIPKGRNLHDSKYEPTDAHNPASPVQVETNDFHIHATIIASVGLVILTLFVTLICIIKIRSRRESKSKMSLDNSGGMSVPATGQATNADGATELHKEDDSRSIYAEMASNVGHRPMYANINLGFGQSVRETLSPASLPRNLWPETFKERSHYATMRGNNGTSTGLSQPTYVEMSFQQRATPPVIYGNAGVFEGTKTPHKSILVPEPHYVHMNSPCLRAAILPDTTYVNMAYGDIDHGP